jgi:hypothetical protein
MNNEFKNIADTNTAFGNLESSCVEIKIKDYQKLHNQAANLYDELIELREDGFDILINDPASLKGRDGMIDAIGDIMVFLYGIPHFLGANYIESRQLHENSIYAAYVEHKKGITEHIKNKAYNVIYDEVKFLIDQIVISINTEGSYNEILTGVRNLDTYLFALTDYYAINTKIAIQLITDSNMSKLCRNEEETEATRAYYRDRGVDVYAKESPLLQENGKPFMVVYSSKEQEVNNKIYRAHKFLKCVTWKEPDLSGL